MSDIIRIAIVESDQLFLAGITHTLQSAPHIKIVGEGTAVADAIRITKTAQPDILVLQLDAGDDALEALRAISSEWPRVKSIVLTASVDHDLVLAALAAGARGYALKNISGSDFLNVVKTIQQGGAYVPPMLAALILRAPNGKSRRDCATSDRGELTVREEQVMNCISRGSTNKEVAILLDLSEKTVKHYMSIILEKLQARNRVEAVLKYRKTVL